MKVFIVSDMEGVAGIVKWAQTDGAAGDRARAGRSRDRYGQPMTIKLKGSVEPYFENAAGEDAQAEGGEGSALEG